MGTPPISREVLVPPFSILRNAINLIFCFLESSWIKVSNVLVLWSFWTPWSFDPDRFRPGQAIFCYIHSHGRGTCRSSMLALSSAIERRARGLSFPLLKIFIGYQQLLQRAAWTLKSWQNTTFCPLLRFDNYTQLVYFVSRPPTCFLWWKRMGKRIVNDE